MEDRSLHRKGSVLGDFLTILPKIVNHLLFSSEVEVKDDVSMGNAVDDAAHLAKGSQVGITCN